jgi:hypothetical protein
MLLESQTNWTLRFNDWPIQLKQIIFFDIYPETTGKPEHKRVQYLTVIGMYVDPMV